MVCLRKGLCDLVNSSEVIVEILGIKRFFFVGNIWKKNMYQDENKQILQI